MNKVLSLGEVITAMLLHSDTPLAVAYRKHLAEHEAEMASIVTSKEKGGDDGTARL